MERPRAPSQQRKPNLSQAPPAEIASAQDRSKEKRETDSAASLSACSRGCGSFLWPSELSGPQLLAYPSQVKQLVFSLFIPTTAIPRGDSRLCAPFLRESGERIPAAGSQNSLAGFLDLSLVALISSDCVASNGRPGN
jgi:hypothetical protein